MFNSFGITGLYLEVFTECFDGGIFILVLDSHAPGYLEILTLLSHMLNLEGVTEKCSEERSHQLLLSSVPFRLHVLIPICFMVIQLCHNLGLALSF